MAMNREVIVIIGAFVVAVYLTILNVTYPLFGIDVVEKKNGDVVVSGVYEFGWAKQHGIRPNDRVLKINGKHPLSHFTVEKYHVIEQAKTITIQRWNQVQTLRVDMKSHGVAQWVYYILLPTVFFLFTIRFSIFCFSCDRMVNQRLCLFICYC